jgi:ABC-type glutathione transport system ATPase component
MLRPISITCSDHEGARYGRVQQWDGKAWKIISDWYTADESLIEPLVADVSAKYAADGKSAIAQDLERVYAYFPRLRERRSSTAGYTSGGEQQMCVIGRALMSRPKMILLDEPSMGLAPQIVEEIFEIVKDLNTKEGVSFLLAEQNTNMALKYTSHGLHPRKWPRGDGRRGAGARSKRGRQGVLPWRRW